MVDSDTGASAPAGDQERDVDWDVSNDAVQVELRRRGHDDCLYTEIARVRDELMGLRPSTSTGKS